MNPGKNHVNRALVAFTYASEDNRYPSRPTPYRYLNSGSYVGRTGAPTEV